MILMLKNTLFTGLEIIFNTRCMIPPFSDASSDPMATCGRVRTFYGNGFGCPLYLCLLPQNHNGGSFGLDVDEIHKLDKIIENYKTMNGGGYSNSSKQLVKILKNSI